MSIMNEVKINRIEERGFKPDVLDSTDGSLIVINEE